MSYTNRVKRDYLRFTLTKNGLDLQSLTMEPVAITSGQSVPNWKDKAKANLQAGSAYSSSSFRVKKRVANGIKLKLIQQFVPGVVQTNEYSGSLGYNSIVSPSSSSTIGVENKALSKIIKKVRQESSHMNGLSFTGELREAIHGLRYPYAAIREKLYSQLTTLSKRKRELGKYPTQKRQQAWRKVVSDTWLETSFGLMPLIHDSKDIAESIARFNLDEPQRVRVSSISREEDASDDWQPSVPWPDGNLRFNRSRKTVHTLGCRYVVGLEGSTIIDRNSLDRLRRILGFTMEDFVPALWEVTPWSWFFDYFSNIGDFIEAGTTNEARVRWIVKSVFIKSFQEEIYCCDRLASIALQKSFGNTVVALEGAGVFSKLELEGIQLTRTVPTTLGLPTFHIFHPFGSLKKDANLLAVLGQISGRTFDPRVLSAGKLPASLTKGQRQTFGAQSLGFQI